MNDLIKSHLEAFVPLAIKEIARDRGQPDEHDLARLHDSASYIGAYGEMLMHRQSGITGAIVDKIVDGLAVLAFCPGGVKAFGLEFEATKIVGVQNVCDDLQVVLE